MGVRSAAAAFLLLLSAAAAAEPAAEPATAASTPAIDFVVFGASFAPDADPAQLANGVDCFTWGFEFAGGLDRHLALGVMFTDVEQRFDTPAVDWPGLGAYDDRMNASTAGLDLSALVPWPTGLLEPYLRAGFGIHRTKLQISGQVLGLPQQLEETDTGIGALAGLGLVVRLGRWRIHGEVRQTWLGGDLPLYGGGDVQLGGRMLVFGLGAGH